MNGSSKYARLAGLALLGSLASLAAGLNYLPSFDARSQYFRQYLPGLIDQRGEFASELGSSLR